MRLLSATQTLDDSAQGAEDTPLTIDALANDIDARQPGYAPVIVTGPAHGDDDEEEDDCFGRNAASVLVHSSAGDPVQVPISTVRYVVVNGNGLASVQTPLPTPANDTAQERVDWTGSAVPTASLGNLGSVAWVSDFLGASELPEELSAFVGVG